MNYDEYNNLPVEFQSPTADELAGNKVFEGNICGPSDETKAILQGKHDEWLIAQGRAIRTEDSRLLKFKKDNK